MLTFLLRLSTLNRETGRLIVFKVSIFYAYFLIETEYFEQRNWKADCVHSEYFLCLLSY